MIGARSRGVHDRGGGLGVEGHPPTPMHNIAAQRALVAIKRDVWAGADDLHATIDTIEMLVHRADQGRRVAR